MVNGRKGNYTTWLTNELAKTATTEVSAPRQKAPKAWGFPGEWWSSGRLQSHFPQMIPLFCSIARINYHLPSPWHMVAVSDRDGRAPQLIHHLALGSTSASIQYWVKNINVSFSRVNEIKLITFSGCLLVNQMDGKRCLSKYWLYCNFLGRLLSKYCSSGSWPACHNLSWHIF